MLPSLPQTLDVIEGSYYFDGGSIRLKARDECGVLRAIYKDQHLTSPGWLYLDNWQIPYRSFHEEALLHCLETWVGTRPPLPNESTDPPSGEAIRTPQGGLCVYLSADIARTMSLSQEDNLTWLAHQIITYTRSDSYGRLPILSTTYQF